MEIETEEEVEVTCPHCGETFTTTVAVTVDIEPQDTDWRD